MVRECTRTRVSVRGILHVFAILLRNPAGVQARRLRRHRNARTKTKLHQTRYTREETREPRQSSTRTRIQTSRATRGPRSVPRTPLREGQGSHVEGHGMERARRDLHGEPPPGWEEGGVCVSLVVTRLSFRRPGARLIIREPSPSVEGKSGEVPHDNAT